MVKISEFQALIAEKNKLKNFSIKSYPEYSSSEIKKELKINPISYLKILEKKNKASNNYIEIKKRIKEFKNKKILIKKRPSIYLYEQIEKNKKYIGFICGISTKDYKKGNIKIHEKTINKRLKIFTKYLEKCKVHAEPILLTYKKDQKIENFIINKTKSKVIYDFKTKDKKEHKIWMINEKKEIIKIKKYFENINELYIADGHHRIASSNAYNESCGSNNPCLAFLVSSNQLTLESFHRVIKNPKSIEQKTLENFISNNSKITELKSALPIKKNEIKIYLNTKWYNFKINQNKKTENEIPVFILSNQILKPILNIKNLTTTDKINYIPNSQLKLEKISKKNNLIFLLPNISIETILEIANKNKTMPPKSTYILPKLRTGLIIMELK